MKNRIRYLSCGAILLLCLSTSCLESTQSSQSKKLKDFESDKCREVPEDQQILFRGMAWGSTQEQVITSMEKEPVFRSPDTLVYHDFISGMLVDAVFVFADDQLTRGKYIFSTKHQHENTYLEKFRDVEDMLTRKYGESAISETTWHNTMFKHVHKDYGLAISMGHMSMLAGWKIGCVKFTHTLSGGNGQIIHGMEYYHIKWQQIEQKARDRLKLKNL